jgi:NAD+ kinase
MVSKIFLVASNMIDADILKRVCDKNLSALFEIVSEPTSADMIFVLGGDGTMLSTIRKYWEFGKPFCGTNFGHVGFLLNSDKAEIYRELAGGEYEVVESRLLRTILTSPSMIQGEPEPIVCESFAVNDVYFRGRNGAARIEVEVNGEKRYSPLHGDGIIVSTALGSTAYNASANGTILPIESNLLALTPICPAIHQGRLQTALLNENARIVLRPRDTGRWPVDFFHDSSPMMHIKEAKVWLSDDKFRIFYAKSERYREKVLRLQFPSRD